MNISELVTNTFREDGVDYSISINQSAIDIKIFNAYGLVEFAAKYPIFRDPRIKELIFFINETLKRIPDDSFLLHIDGILNEKFLSIMQEKDILYRIEWPKVPQDWKNKDFFIRNYKITKELDDEDLKYEDDDGNIVGFDLTDYDVLRSLFNYSVYSIASNYLIPIGHKNNNFYLHCLVPDSLENQTDPGAINIGTASVGGGSSSSGSSGPSLPAVLPFEDQLQNPDGVKIDLNLVHPDEIKIETQNTETQTNPDEEAYLSQFN